MERTERKLTPKQAAFVREYLIDLNATQAAIRAGYSADTAYSIGQENLKKPEIAEAIEEAMDERAQRTEITADKVIQEIAKLAFSNIGSYVRLDDNGLPRVDLSGVTHDQFAAISEVQSETVFEGTGEGAVPVRKAKLKFHDKKGSLELLGRHLGLFNDKLQLNMSGMTEEEFRELGKKIFLDKE